MPFDLRVPIERNNSTTFQLVDNFPMLVRHKLRCLLLTLPGERVMYPDYGIGIQRFLFEQAARFPESEMRILIQSQVNKYLSFVNIIGINITYSDLEPNKAVIRLEYAIPRLNLRDLVLITI